MAKPPLYVRIIGCQHNKIIAKILFELLNYPAPGIKGTTTGHWT